MVLIGTSGFTVTATGIKQAPCSTILCVFLTMGPRKVFWDSHWKTGRWVGITGVGATSAIPKEGGVRQMRLPYLDGKVLKIINHSINYWRIFTRFPNFSYLGDIILWKPDFVCM